MKVLINILFTGKGVAVYYTFLLAIMMSWTDFSSFPPMVMRLAYLGMVMLPTCIDRNSLMPATLVCFWGIAINGYAYSYMPTMDYLYVGILMSLLPFMHRSSKEMFTYTGTIVPLIMLTIITIRNLIGDLEIQNITPILTIILILPAYISKRDGKAILKVEIAFMAMSLVLSYFSFTTQSLFTGVYGSYGGEDRSSWTDPNYLCMTMGMGALIGFKQILHFKSISITQKILGITAVTITIPAMLGLASRGGILCLVVGMIVMLSFAKISPAIKTLVTLCAIGFVVFLYTNDFFIMLEERINSDDGTGSERILIWANRLSAFVNSDNPIMILFGYSYHGGLKLGWPFEFGSHNDFIAFLAEYGIIGLALFLLFMAIPILNMRNMKTNKTEVLAYLSFLLFSCMTLEPFSQGRLLFYMFWFYILMFVVMTKQKEKRNDALSDYISKYKESIVVTKKIK